MSSTQQNPSSTNTPARPRPGANHRHSKSSSSIAQVPKRHNNRNYNGQNSRSVHPPNHNGNSNSNLPSFPSKSKGSADDNILVHVRSDPTPIAAGPETPPKGNKSGKLAQPYASDGGNLSSNEKKGRKKRQPKRPKDLNTAAASKAVIDGFPGVADEEPSLPPLPHTAKPFATPGKHYAGPTFHHSPAPSALPLPSFFSKSVPSTPNGPSFSAMMSSEESDTSDSSPSSDTKNEESPLAKLFRVDSEERAAGLRPQRRSRRESLLDDNPFRSRSTGNLPGTNGLNLYDAQSNSSGADMLFAMDSVDKKTQPLSDAKKTRVNDGSNEVELEAARKRKEKASALKEILLQHAPASPEPLRHGISLPLSPSPKSRNGMKRQENFRNKTLVKHNNYSTTSSSPTTPKANKYSTLSTDQANNSAIPKKQVPLGNVQNSVPSKDPKVIEDYLRWALKMDTASATGVRG